MRRGGAESWRFAHDIDQSLHNALYVRDALGLVIDEQVDAPPRLMGDIPDRSGLLDADGLGAAAAQWPAWWRSMVAGRATEQLMWRSTTEDPRARAHEALERLQRLVDPPEWTSLDDSPALREAARALWTESIRWFGVARRAHVAPTRSDVFEWHSVRESAKRAAAAHHVSPSEIDGCAEVLLVEGIWWQLAAPGAALCSIGAASAPATAALILKDVFDSHVAA